MEKTQTSIASKAWYAIYTKPKSELKIANTLNHLGIENYCPTTIEYHQWSDRVKKVEAPLIKSYLFVRVASKYRNQVFDVPGVVRYVFWLGKPAVVADTDITVLKEWMQNDLMDAQISQIQPGDCMKVPRGPFKGQEGIVHEVNNNRLQLLLVSLGIKITLTKQSALKCT